MDEHIKVLQQQFQKIKKMEYVKSIKKGNTGVSATFKYLLEKTSDNLEIPIPHGLKIKTKRSYSKACITLFNAVPTGSNPHEVKRLRDIYGTTDAKDKNLKQLKAEIFSSKLNKINYKYHFKLSIDRKEEKIYLYIYDNYKNLIDKSTYWSFKTLKEKISKNLQVLVMVKAWPNKVGEYEYFKYYKMNIYILKNFNAFIESLEKGFIKIMLNIGSYHDEKRYGQVSSHIVSFCIAEEDLLSIFDLYR